MSKPFELALETLSDADLSGAGYYEDAQMRIEEDALEIYTAQQERGEITSEDCNALYADWMRKYRGQHPRPDFKIE